MRNQKKESEEKTWRFYTVDRTLAAVRGLTAMYVVTILLDAAPVFSGWLTDVKDIMPWLQIRLWDKATGLLGAYGVVWAATVGAILFVVQRGYGKVLGLQVGEIIGMLLNPVQMIGVLGYIIGKFLLYVLAYLFYWRCTLIWGAAECFFSFAIVIWFFVRLPNLTEVSYLLIEEMNSSMGKHFYAQPMFEECRSKIMKCVRNINYESSDECKELPQILAAFLHKMGNLENIPQKTNDVRLFPGEEEMMRLFAEKELVSWMLEEICFTDAGKKRILDIVQDCVNNLLKYDENVQPGDYRDGSFKIYMLLKCLIEVPAFNIDAETIKNILALMKNEYAEEVLAYLIPYTAIWYQEQSRKELSRIYLHSLAVYQNSFWHKTPQEEKIAADNARLCGCRVIFYEYEKMRIEGKKKENFRRQLALLLKYRELSEWIERGI